MGEYPIEKKLKENVPFDREKQYAVVHASICTGEMVAGFKNLSDSHFTEDCVKQKENSNRFSFQNGNKIAAGRNGSVSSRNHGI